MLGFVRISGETNCLRFPEASFRLIPIPQSDCVELLQRTLLFDDDDRFAKQYASILEMQKDLPACVLRYGNDPGVAAKAIQDLVSQQAVF